MITTITVPTLSLAFCCVSAILSIGIPILLVVLCARRHRATLRAVFTGAICFVVGAMILEGLLHRLVLTVLIPDLPLHPVAYILYGCLAAGVFEETSRLVGLLLLSRRDTSPVIGFAYGVGHGGVEAVLIGGLSAVNNIATIVMVNSGQTDTLLNGFSGDTLALALEQLEQLAQTPSPLFLASGLERMVTLAFHIALSMLIWMVSVRRIPLWGFGIAILLHAAIDVFAMLYQLGIITNIWFTEVALVVLVPIVCIGIWRIYKHTEVTAT